MVSAVKDFRVLVIGGGNCGLAIATGLKKAGIPYTVFERDSEDVFQQTPRDWGMLLHWGTEYLERVLPPDLQARIKEARVHPSHEMVEPLPRFNGATGEIIMRLQTDVISRVSRKKLRRLLTEGQSLDIQFNKKLRSLDIHDDLVTAEFEDGTRETGSIVIGSDGTHSKVREFLLGVDASKAEDTGITLVNGPATGYTAEEARILRSFHPIVQLALHPTSGGGALVAVLDIPENSSDPQTWRFQTYTSWKGPPTVTDLEDPVVRMRWLRQRMATYCEPFRTAFLSPIDRGYVLPIYRGYQWSPPKEPWNNHNGRVTLAGDAAHSMLPHRGQGLNNAMQDAALVVEAIVQAYSAGADVTQALSKSITAYEEEMRPRGATEVALSYETAMTSETYADFGKSPLLKLGHSKLENNETRAEEKVNI